VLESHVARSAVIINDHPSVGQGIGADGAHVGREDPPVAEARALLVRRPLLGRPAMAMWTRFGCRAGGRRYVAFGTPFPSPTKSTKRTDISIGIFQERSAGWRVPCLRLAGITIAMRRDYRCWG